MTTQEEQWIAGERRLTLFAGGASESQARARASTRAEQLCRGFAASTQFRLDSADTDGAYTCEDGACGITGEAICRLHERQVINDETCGAPQ